MLLFKLWTKQIFLIYKRVEKTCSLSGLLRSNSPSGKWRVPLLFVSQFEYTIFWGEKETIVGELPKIIFNTELILLPEQSHWKKLLNWRGRPKKKKAKQSKCVLILLYKITIFFIKNSEKRNSSLLLSDDISRNIIFVFRITFNNV